MAKKDTEFSKYATAFFEVIYGSKSGKAIFVKELLKLGLSDEDKEYLDDTFPMVKNSKGKSFIEKNKADQLRKYLRGYNDISDIVSNLETEFDLEFQKRYCDDLQWYDEEKVIAFAHSLNIAVETDEFEEISEAIAEYYSAIIENVVTKKSRKCKKVQDEPELDRNKMALSYTLTKPEKKALVKLCELTNKSMRDLKNQADKIINKQKELRNLTDSNKFQRWKSCLVYDIDSLKKLFDEEYTELEKLCADIVILLENKKGIHKSLGTILSIASNVNNDEYKITCPNEFNYSKFSNMVKRFDDSYSLMLRNKGKL